MPRPRTNHDEKRAIIVDAATRTFARYGYEGTTNKLIAQAIQESGGASFTPALIYHYFPEGKLQLFTMVMQQYRPLQTLGQQIQDNLHEPPEVFLRTIAHAYTTAFRTPHAAQLIQIVFTEGARQPEVSAQFIGRVGPLILVPLMTYLAKESMLGRLRPIHPLSFAFEFFGPMLARIFILQTFGPVVPVLLPSDDEFIECHVRTILNGLAVP